MLQSVLQQYFISSEQQVEPVKNGRINDTYIVGTDKSKVVLQSINAHVFTSPQVVAENFFAITRHLADKRPRYRWFEFADSINTLSGDSYFVDSTENVWRCQSYVSSAAKPELTAANLQQLGKILGTFHLLLSDFDSSLLGDPLPGFHHLPTYLANYKQNKDVNTATSAELFCHDLIGLYKSRALELHNAVELKQLDVFIIHGDPKLDNFVFDVSGKAKGLIDLDTVYKGAPHIDLGDSLRSLCANNGNGGLDLAICENFLRGYLGASSQIFTQKSREYIFSGILTIAYELGLRFFTDHLAGDIYFKVAEHGENLDRAITQFKLVSSIIDNEAELRKMASLL